MLKGSSPHTRGARLSLNGEVPGARIIPAYAGSTCRISRSGPAHPDHPRIRGEHVSMVRRCKYLGGSSPHTRGARPGRSRPPDHGGIIPAYAGSTPPRDARKPNSWDHPRIRGEHASESFCIASYSGSSPHTRGARRRSRAARRASRIIPAYAGSTSSRAGPSRGYRDHPRIRGEHNLAKRTGLPSKGSSPHTRGARSSAGCR